MNGMNLNWWLDRIASGVMYVFGELWDCPLWGKLAIGFAIAALLARRAFDNGRGAGATLPGSRHFGQQ